MSGGHFDYAYRYIKDFADDLQQEIDMNGVNNSDSPTVCFKDETIKALQECQKMMEVTSKIAKDIEWLYSGDIDEGEFMQRLKDALNNI